ncbi:MAG TPA: CdaR family protein [Candidatus Dormibacteraeota bacterium]|nr:CdaR family protein [Candidatus Dormibacteraeota bacterium]
MKVPAFLTRNLQLKAVAAGLALVSWAAVVYAANPPEQRTVTVKVPQDSQLLPAKFVLAQAIPDVAIRVQGTRDHVNAFDPRSITVSVDYNAIKGAGKQTLPLTIVNRDSNVDLDNPPTSIDANTDVKATANVPVTIVHKVNPPADYFVAAESATPDHVTLIGPQRELDGVMALVEVDLGNRKTNLTRELNVIVHDSSGHSLGDVGVQVPTVTVDITIKPAAATRTSAVLPHLNGTPANGFFVAGFSADPLLVVLNGPQDVLNGLDSVPTDPINVAGITSDRVVTVRLQLPAGVSASPNTVTVHVGIGAVPTPTPGPTPTPSPSPKPSPT